MTTEVGHYRFNINIPIAYINLLTYAGRYAICVYAKSRVNKDLIMVE